MTNTACPHGVKGCPHEVSPNVWQVCTACRIAADPVFMRGVREGYEASLRGEGIPAEDYFKRRPRQVKAR